MTTLALAAACLVAACTRAQPTSDRADRADPAPVPVERPAPPTPEPAPPAPTAPAPTAPSPAPPSKDPAMTAQTTQLTWKMTRDKDRLRVEYQIDNQGTTVLHVNDGLAILMNGGKYVRSSNINVTEASPDTARIWIGRPRGDVPMAVVPPGVFVAIAPGGSFKGSRELQLPLRRWDEMGREHALSKKLTKATFAIEAFEGEPPSWRELPLQTGASIKVPEGFSARELTGAAQPLP